MDRHLRPQSTNLRIHSFHSTWQIYFGDESHNQRVGFSDQNSPLTRSTNRRARTLRECVQASAEAIGLDLVALDDANKQEACVRTTTTTTNKAASIRQRIACVHVVVRRLQPCCAVGQQDQSRAEPSLDDDDLRSSIRWIFCPLPSSSLLPQWTARTRTRTIPQSAGCGFHGQET